MFVVPFFQRQRQVAGYVILQRVSRGATRRVSRLVTSGAVSEELLRAADREADLLAHPYIGLEHVQLARLGLNGRAVDRDVLRQQMRIAVTKRWWQIRGPRSALRPAGVEETEAAHHAAEQEEHGRGPQVS